MPTIANIITYANISSYLCVDDNQQSGWYKGGIKTQKNLAELIYMVRKSVVWMNGQDSSYATLQQTANYLYSLCNKYVFQAIQISGQGGGGTVISPTTSIGIASPLRITSADFSTATAWDDSRIDSAWTLQVFWNDIPRFLVEGVDWSRTSTGIDITVSGFDANSNNYELYIFISNT